jgi:hypothetical protein
MQSLKLIALYLYICEVYDTELKFHCQRFHRNGKAPDFSDEELLTVYLFAIMEEEKLKIKEIWRYTQRYWLSWFPKLPSYQAFDARLNRMAAVFPYLLAHLIKRMPPSDTLDQQISVLDSFPIMMCNHKRSAKVGLEIADKGYCATKKTHYHGVKLHFMGFFQPGTLPFPEWIQISPASWHDLTAIRPILPTIKDRAIFADMSYCDKPLNQHLLKEHNTYIYTPVKLVKGQSKWERQWHHAADKLFSTAVSRIRQSVESIFNWFIQKVDLQNASKVRSQKGIIVHVFGRLSAAFAKLIFYP